LKRVFLLMTMILTLLIGTSVFAADVWYPTETHNSEGSLFSPEVTQKISDAVVLYIGSSKAYVNGNEGIVDSTNIAVTPFIEGSRTLVPVRFISENLGAAVDWNDMTKTVTVSLNGKNVEIAINSNIIKVDGTEKQIDVPAQIKNERTFIPLRALVEALGKEVFWDNRGLILISDTGSIFDTTTEKGLIDEIYNKFITSEDEEDVTRAEIQTSKGTIIVELQNAKMPITVGNFTDLVNKNFYDGLTFHRAEDWVIQGGDPNGNGTGGSGKTIPLETNPDLENVRGALAMARAADPDSASCQFYILKTDAHWLDGQYAVFGNVVSGIDIVDKIEIGDEIKSIRMQ